MMLINEYNLFYTLYIPCFNRACELRLYLCMNIHLLIDPGLSGGQ